MNKPLPAIAVLGASGLIGEAVANFLMREGFPVIAIARRFTAAQKFAFGDCAEELPLVGEGFERLAKLLRDRHVEIVVNCVGVLQDSGIVPAAAATGLVHCAFVERLVTALGAASAPPLLVHISIPGESAEDATAFSQTKRQAERVISAGDVPFVILRPGFVIASTAYGGSALMRALAMLPFDLSVQEADRPFATTDVSDIARTIVLAGNRWRDGKRDWASTWDVMARQKTSAGEVLEAFRLRFGQSGRRVALPAWIMTAGANAGDMASTLGWLPPIRSTALREMRRGVTGDPIPWIEETGIEPISVDAALRHLQVNVQEKWFARLYLAKALIFIMLVVFWVMSGLISLTVSFKAAAAILVAHGFGVTLANIITAISSLMDISVGVAIGLKRTSQIGLLAGIAVSLFYMIGSAFIAPDLWIEPLGALVKTGPAIVLMLVALAILEDR